MRTSPNCKINLGLQVMRRRPDGYHDLESLFLPVSLCDELAIEPAPCFSFSQDGIAIDGDPGDNLVVRAYRLLRDAFPDRVGEVYIRLTKQIPFGAGLGGGSSDAAFTLKMLNELFALSLSSEELRRYAARLGADCPFFIDNVPTYVTGIGDLLTPLDFNPINDFRMLLVKPDEAVSTAEAYRGITPRDRWDKGDAFCGDLRQLVKQPVERWRDTVVNDFERSVFPSHPKIEALKRAFYEAGARYASMTGSGSAVFALFDADAPIADLQRRLAVYGQLFVID